MRIRLLNKDSDVYLAPTAPEHKCKAKEVADVVDGMCVFQQGSAVSCTDLVESVVSLSGTKSPETHKGLQRSRTTVCDQVRPCLFLHINVSSGQQTTVCAGRMQDKVCVLQMFQKLLELRERLLMVHFGCMLVKTNGRWQHLQGSSL